MAEREFEDCALWRASLGPQSGDRKEPRDARELLRTGLRSFRKSAKLLAREIAQSYPWLTVHDETHFDALWGLASLAAGRCYPLNAAEGFVLGGAILIHDLGCGLAAYPRGLPELQETTEWRDAAATRFRRQHGRAPSEAELCALPPPLLQASVEDALRRLHAERAARLPSTEWPGTGGERHRLLDNADLRHHFGELIGLVGASHGWDVADLTDRLPRRANAPSWLPSEWSVDPVKVACLLRIADKAHLDERRAPAFLRTLRRPEGESATHWAFQERLARASVEGDRLLYTSKMAFERKDAAAWWRCFETLRCVDREIHLVQGLMANRRERGRSLSLAVNGVAGVGDPRQLARYVRTRDWSPVDARVHVGDVATLVSLLGGSKLYGDDPQVPLRELIQNGADAVRAARCLGLRPPEGGDIRVHLGGEDGARWIEVEDDGVGMSERVMTDHLLDFTKPFWSTEAASWEHPGLAASPFTPAGRFGMGFFSAFTWGPRVQVASRRHDRGIEDARILEFEQGLGTRPLVRRVQRGDGFRGPGTRVRVWFEGGGIPKGLVVTGSRSRLAEARELKGLLAWLAPALDVSISVVDPNGRELRAVRANDWRSIPARALLARTSRRGVVRGSPARVTEILEEGAQVLGRAAAHSGFDEGTLVAGGMRVCSLRGVAGILLGKVSVVARNAGVPLASDGALRSWATEQARLWTTAPPAEQVKIAPLIDMLGGDLGGLKMARIHGGEFVSLEEVKASAAAASEFLVADREIPEAYRDEYPDLVFVAERSYCPWKAEDHRAHYLSRHFARLAADAWNTTPS